MNLDEFTSNCVTRAREKTKPTASEESSDDNVGFSFLPFLIPLIQTAIEFLVERLGQCDKDKTEMIEDINNGTFAARFVMNQATAQAIRQTGVRQRGAGTFVKNIIIEEAQETDDEELVSLLDESDSYHFDATDVWG